MDQQKIIAEIEARAQAVGLPMFKLCEAAGIHPTTFSRWKLSEKNPRPIGATLASLSKLEAVLAAYPPVASPLEVEPEQEAA